jgi:hypothetical protein
MEILAMSRFDGQTRIDVFVHNNIVKDGEIRKSLR